MSSGNTALYKGEIVTYLENMQEKEDFIDKVVETECYDDLVDEIKSLLEDNYSVDPSFFARMAFCRIEGVRKVVCKYDKTVDVSDEAACCDSKVWRDGKSKFYSEVREVLRPLDKAPKQGKAKDIFEVAMGNKMRRDAAFTTAIKLGMPVADAERFILLSDGMKTKDHNAKEYIQWFVIENQLGNSDFNEIYKRYTKLVTNGAKSSTETEDNKPDDNKENTFTRVSQSFLDSIKIKDVNNEKEKNESIERLLKYMSDNRDRFYVPEKNVQKILCHENEIKFKTLVEVISALNKLNDKVASKQDSIARNDLNNDISAGLIKESDEPTESAYSRNNACKKEMIENVLKEADFPQYVKDRVRDVFQRDAFGASLPKSRKRLKEGITKYDIYYAILSLFSHFHDLANEYPSDESQFNAACAEALETVGNRVIEGASKTEQKWREEVISLIKDMCGIDDDRKKQMFSEWCYLYDENYTKTTIGYVEKIMKLFDMFVYYLSEVEKFFIILSFTESPVDSLELVAGMD